MQIFIYEFITGGGLWSKLQWGEPGGSLLDEGMAMLLAIASDFGALPGIQVVAMRDSRVDCPPLPKVQYETVNSVDCAQECFASLSVASDMTLVIAPEIDGVLVECCEAVCRLGGNLIGTEVAFARLASDKNATCQALAEMQIPTPKSFMGNESRCWELAGPCIVKPRFGAGSTAVRLLETIADLRPEESNDANVVQEYVSGRPASVSVVRGTDTQIILPPCWQAIDSHFSYTGGRLIAEADLKSRAENLARLVTERLPGLVGYCGIDLILGSSKESDRVVELNPRLTTSYVGLRAAFPTVNLADAMLKIWNGDSVELPAPDLSRAFLANGTIL